MKALSQYLKIFSKSKSGVAAVEFALVAPVLLIMALSSIDASTAISDSLDLKTAARIGAEYALTNSDDSAGIQAAVVAATSNSADTMTVSSTVFCECAKVAVLCGETCPLDESVPNQFVTVSVSDVYSPLFLPQSFSQIEAEVTLPIQ